MDAMLIRWPDEATRLEEARTAGVPRLLLVAAESEPPQVTDPLEDWVRMPAPDVDVKARVATLEARAARTSRPLIDGDGIISFGDKRVALSPVEQRLTTALVERWGSVVGRDALTTSVWPDAPPSRNALDVHVLRLRRRIHPLGLQIKTVRSRGYLLQPAEGGESVVL